TRGLTLDVGLDLLRGAVADRDRPRLQPLRHVAHEVDVKQAVLQVRARYLDMVGKLEPELESAGRDAAMEELAALVVVLTLTLYGERLLLHQNVDFILGETGDSHRNPILVIGLTLNVVRGVGARLALDATIQKLEKAVESDGRTIEGGKIEGSHRYSPP